MLLFYPHFEHPSQKGSKVDSKMRMSTNFSTMYVKQVFAYTSAEEE